MFAASKSSAVAAAATDPYWSSVSLLTNFENNLSFQDGSANNLAITRTGTVTPNLSTPFSGGVGGSVYVLGPSSYLSAAGGTHFDFGAGDFTVECWIKAAATQPAFAGIITRTVSGTPRFTLNFPFASNGGLQFWFDAIGLVAASTTPLNDGAWHHIAATRSSNVFRVFVDGVVGTTTTTNATALGSSTDPVLIGVDAQSSASRSYTGNISNVRIVKGTAVYTTNFTPPTAPLTAITNTSLLVTGTGQGMFNNSTFVDQGPNALTVTATGSPVYSGRSPFGNTYPGSVLFNGSTSYLSIGGNANLSLTTSTIDFTIEAWINPNNFGGAVTTIVALWAQTGVGDQYIFYLTTSGVLEFYWSPFSTSVVMLSGGTVSQNTWSHVAVTRSGNTFRLYLNGTQISSNTSTGTAGSDAATTIGRFGNGSTGASPTSYFSGYISNLRIVKGTALYTANFTPSTTPLTAVTNTSLLVRGDTGAFYDLSNNGLALTANGATAKITTAASKFGSLSTVYDGTQASAINVEISALLNMPGDFTLEAWANVPTATVQTNYAVIYSTTNTYIESSFGGTNNFTAYSVTPAFNINSGIAAKDSTWHFLALVRFGTTITFYVDGVNKGTTTTSTVVDLGSPTQARIGAGNNGALDNPFNGYIDSIRITKGVARYTANFTPPATTFPLS